MRGFTSEELADPLVLGVTGLRLQSVGQVTVHSTVPPVILFILIFNERRHHLHETRQRFSNAHLLNITECM